MAIEVSRDPTQFAAFEQAGWDSNIEGYDRAFGDVARQTVAPMLQAAGVRGGTRALDVCCGPGMLAAGALALGGEPVGLDFAAPAVALARRLVPGATFEQGDAQALPFPDARFDVVLCGYGLMHVPNPTTALREMLRVLRPGGRVAISVWDTAAIGFSLVYEAIRASGSSDFTLPHGPDFFQFGTEDRMRAALVEAGFTDVTARSVPQTWYLRDAGAYVDAILTGTVRARAALMAQGPAHADAVRAYIATALERFRTEDGRLGVPLPAIVGAGARPDGA